MYGYYFDPTYILVIIGAVVCLIASGYMRSTFRKYSRIRSRSGMTGAEAAKRILNGAGITDVRIERVNGDLTDHYDPRSKVLRLSDSVHSSNSVAAIGVAAHECGHAIQHNTSYVPLKLRSALVPAANIGSKLGLPLVILGMILGINIPLPGLGNITLIDIGIVIFSVAVLFQVITLPVEFNASSRALRALGDYGLMGNEEVGDCRHVLTAAALTYVAAAASAVLQLLRLILLSNSRRRND
ncbi:MAG: zinc metallopeptidase [Lachnospiraceae bacterium]|jgi:Zn-dependent membrane protease YugP|nr:zinc metallopeptidase [Lachnospiraceae bacterium]